jgi:hypothetical protein
MAVAIDSARTGARPVADPAAASQQEFDGLLQAVLDAWGRVEDLREAGAPLHTRAPALFALDAARGTLRRHQRRYERYERLPAEGLPD